MNAKNVQKINEEKYQIGTFLFFSAMLCFSSAWLDPSDSGLRLGIKIGMGVLGAVGAVWGLYQYGKLRQKEKK
ncbi:hypothetical protein [Paenibacillus agri]|uniref:Uncharacterized protein n=1 Tax=Paenibacillus agri TaxID=2744309 RepID=A0A850EPQ2_9BACL|nr:hypothetical protein [Paenibacillus agri]NUU61720.1 hypothetical protein [Paenibacillus agri]